jgi:hypothetical protein
MAPIACTTNVRYLLKFRRQTPELTTCFTVVIHCHLHTTRGTSQGAHGIWTPTDSMQTIELPAATWLGPLSWWIPWKVQGGFAAVGRLMGKEPILENDTDEADRAAIKGQKEVSGHDVPCEGQFNRAEDFNAGLKLSGLGDFQSEGCSWFWRI